MQWRLAALVTFGDWQRLRVFSRVVGGACSPKAMTSPNWCLLPRVFQKLALVSRHQCKLWTIDYWLWTLG